MAARHSQVIFAVCSSALRERGVMPLVSLMICDVRPGDLLFRERAVRLLYKPLLTSCLFWSEAMPPPIPGRST